MNELYALIIVGFFLGVGWKIATQAFDLIVMGIKWIMKKEAAG
jgi:hypothetical protein